MAFGRTPGSPALGRPNLAQGMVRETLEFLQGDILYLVNLFHETPSNFLMCIEWAGFGYTAPRTNPREETNHEKSSALALSLSVWHCRRPAFACANGSRRDLAGL